jgi:hypothetical protein
VTRSRVGGRGDSDPRVAEIGSEAVAVLLKAASPKVGTRGRWLLLTSPLERPMTRGPRLRIWKPTAILYQRAENRGSRARASSGATGIV